MPWKNETGKPVYVNADKSKVVEEGPEAAFLLVGAEGELSDEEAEKYGLTGKQAPAAEDKPAADKAEAPADDKAVEKPPANKGR